MAGYSRQSVSEIIPTAVVKSAPVNAEFNALRDTFAFATGHTHDGSATEGAYVPLIADTDANNKVAVDTSNNRVGVFLEVSSAAVEQVRFEDGVIVPVTDNDIDLGTSSVEFKNAYIDGTAFIDTVSIGDNDYTTITNNAYTTTGNLTFDVSGNINLDADGGNIALQDAGTTYATFTNNSGNLTLKSGTTTAATFTGANVDFAGTVDVTGAVTLDSTLLVKGNTTLGDAVTDTVTYTARSVTNFLPNADATYDLGSSSLEWNNLWLDGTANVDTLQVDENAAVTGSMSVGGNMSTTGNNVIGGNLNVNGNTTLGNAATDTVTITADVASNIIPSADSTYSLGDSSNYWSHGYIDAITTTGNVTVGGALSVGTTLDMTNGQINNLAAPSLSSDAATKGYVDTADALKLNLSGGTMSGAIAMGTNKITGLGTPTDTADAATKGYVDTTVAAVIDSAPGALDTLNELAAALGDDANFSTTVTNSIATKLALAGGTMTGDIVLGSNKITSTATPATDDTLTRKGYVDTQDALKLSLSGGTMSGNIAMGGNTVTGLATPSASSDAVTKGYVDTAVGSLEDAAFYAAAAEAAYDSFDDRYLGAKASAPAVDNDGNALITGALYFDSTANLMKVYDGSSWVDAGSAVNGTAERNVYTATGGQTTFSVTYDVGFVDVYLNGVKLVAGTDFTATNGTSVVLVTGATAGDIVDIVAYGAFSVANTYTQAAADAKFLQVTNNLSDLNDAATALNNLGLTATADELNVLDGITADVNELNILDGVTATTAEINYLDVTTLGTSEASKAVTTDANGVTIFDGGIVEDDTTITSSGGAATLNCQDGNVFSHTLTEDVTYTFSNAPASGRAFGFTLKVVQDSTARTITWPASVDWPAATAPTLSTGSGEVDVFVFFTTDGGTIWYGFTAGQVLS